MWGLWIWTLVLTLAWEALCPESFLSWLTRNVTSLGNFLLSATVIFTYIFNLGSRQTILKVDKYTSLFWKQKPQDHILSILFAGSRQWLLGDCSYSCSVLRTVWIDRLIHLCLGTPLAGTSTTHTSRTATQCVLGCHGLTWSCEKNTLNSLSLPFKPHVSRRASTQEDFHGVFTPLSL